MRAIIYSTSFKLNSVAKFILGIIILAVCGIGLVLASKVADKLNISSFASAYAYVSDFVPVESNNIQVNDDFPRIIRRQLTAEGQNNSYGSQTAFELCNQAGIGALIACVRTNPSAQQIKRAFETGANFTPQSAKASGSQHNAWMLALLYDQIATLPGYEEQKRDIEASLILSLRNYLDRLQWSTASLWHSRLSLASHAFILAVTVGHLEPELLQQATYWFSEVVSAMQLTEAWPSGYNYWIVDRALPFVLASSAYINGTDGQFKQALVSLIKKVGYWQIYMTRPDGRIENIGDEGPRVDLKDVSKPVVDLMTRVTGDPILATYSRYIASVHGRESYYRHYRWQQYIFPDKSIQPIGKNTQDLSVLDNLLPPFAIFGEGQYNQIVMRSGWGKDAVFFQARGGHVFSHHQHYDAGHFTLFFRQPLLSDASVYHNNFYKKSRLEFSLQSLSKNTLTLFERDGRETSGGQKVALPTGSSYRNVAHWKSDKSSKGAELIRFVDSHSAFGFVEFNLSQAYPQTESDMRRSFLFLPDTGELLINDRVTGLIQSTRVKQQFHSQHLFVPQTGESVQSVTATGIHDLSIAYPVTLAGTSAGLQFIHPFERQSKVYVGDEYRYMVAFQKENGLTQLINMDDHIPEPDWFDNPTNRLVTNMSAENKLDSLTLIQANMEKSSFRPVSGGNDNVKVVELTHFNVVYLKDWQKKLNLGHGIDKSLIVVGSSGMQRLELDVNGKVHSLKLTQGIGQLDLE